MRLQKILGIVLVAGCISCNQLQESIHDTLYGSNTDSSYKKTNDNIAGSNTGSTTTTTTTIEESSSTITSSSKQTSESGFLANTAGLDAAERALRNLPVFSGKSIYVYGGIHFYDDGRVNAKVQNARNPEYIDEYDFSNGSWEEPKPVQLSVHDDIKKALVKLDDISFANVAAVYRNYRMKSDSVEGTDPLTYIYAVFNGGNVTWYPQSIDGSRERYFISFTPTGSLKDFYRE